MVEATIKYPKGHSYTFQYSREETMYCPHCGVLGRIWCENGPGDYYTGPTHYCGACAATFTIQDGGLIKEDHTYFPVIEAIRTEGAGDGSDGDK